MKIGFIRVVQFNEEGYFDTWIKEMVTCGKLHVRIILHKLPTTLQVRKGFWVFQATC